MSKLVQRLAAMVAMTAVVLGATIGGVSSMMIHYKPLNEGAETVLTVNGDAVAADEYSGYMLYNMQYYASMYAQMGLTDLWSNKDMAKSLGASMPEAAEQQAIYARVVMQKFNELGLKLSYNEQKEMASVRRNSIANTTKDAYLNQIAQFGFSDQTYQNFMYISQCYQALNDYYFGENGVNTPSDEDIQKYYEDNYITAKHILITTVDPACPTTRTATPSPRVRWSPSSTTVRRLWLRTRFPSSSRAATATISSSASSWTTASSTTSRATSSPRSPARWTSCSSSG